LPIRVLFAFNREPIVNVVALSEQVEKRCPGALAFPTCQEGFGVAHNHDGFACTRQQDVGALWSCHETDVASAVAATQTGDDDVAFFALVIV
jgi:hypothetical protein